VAFGAKGSEMKITTSSSACFPSLLRADVYFEVPKRRSDEMPWMPKGRMSERNV